jgi:hypothetical protein
MHQRTAYLGRNVVLAAMLLIGCGDSGPDEDEPGTAGFTFVTITQDGKPWQAEASGFQMLGPGHASFGWQRQLAAAHSRKAWSSYSVASPEWETTCSRKVLWRARPPTA